MTRSQHRSGGIIVGVDAGGTWVRVRAQADSRPIVALTQSASAVPELATFLHSLWRRRGWKRPRVDALVVAARGVWLPRERRALHRRRRAGAPRHAGGGGGARAAAATARGRRRRGERDERSLVRGGRAQRPRAHRTARAVARVRRRARRRRRPPRGGPRHSR